MRPNGRIPLHLRLPNSPRVSNIMALPMIWCLDYELVRAMKRYIVALFAAALLVSVGCDGCGSSEDKGEESGDESTAAQQVDQPDKATEDDQPDKPKEPPKPSEWSASITGEEKSADIGGPIVNAVDRSDPSGTGEKTLVIQMQPEPNDASKTSGRMIIRGFMGAKSETGKLDVIRVDVVVPSAELTCTDADVFDVFIDKYTEFQVEGSFEGTLACKDGKTYDVSGTFRD